MMLKSSDRNNNKKRFARSKAWIKARFFSSFFYALCRISPAAAASMDKRTRHCCSLCRVEPRVTPGTPQRPYQNNKHCPDWPRAAPPSRWSWGVAVSRSLSSPLAPTATPAPVTLGAARRTEAYLMRRFLPCLPLGLRLNIARHCILKIFCSTEHFDTKMLVIFKPLHLYLDAKLCIWPHWWCRFIPLPVTLLGSVFFFFVGPKKQVVACPTSDLLFLFW